MAPEPSAGGVLFTVQVAEPLEVIRWARQFGDEAEIVKEDSHTGKPLEGDVD